MLPSVSCSSFMHSCFIEMDPGRKNVCINILLLGMFMHNHFPLFISIVPFCVVILISIDRIDTHFLNINNMGAICPIKHKDQDGDKDKGRSLSRRQRKIITQMRQPRSEAARMSGLTLTSHRDDEESAQEQPETHHRMHRKTIYDFKVIRGLGKGTFGNVYLIKEREMDESQNIDEHILAYQNDGDSPSGGDVPELMRLDDRNQLHGSNRNDQNKQAKKQVNLKSKSKVSLQSELTSSRRRQDQQLYKSQAVPGGRYFALKILKKSELCSEKQKKQVLSERWILQSNDHPFIVKLHYAFQSRTKLYMVVDLMAGGQLFYLLRRHRRFPEVIAKFYAAQILLALEYLHSKSIIYRDLKPQNILLDRSGHIKLTDFGLSKILYSLNQKTYSLCGTVEYMAPEVIIGGGYTQAADWFSYASLLYDMLTGKPPFLSDDRMAMMNDLASKQVPLPDSLSPEAKDLLGSLFKIDPEQRLGSKYGASEIKNHKFFKDIDFGAVSRKDIDAPISFETPGGEQSLVNNRGFEQWNSCNLNIVSPPSLRPHNKSPAQHFEGFTFDYASSEEGGNLL